MKALKNIFYFLMLLSVMLLTSCDNNDFPESTKPETDYITVFGNGETETVKYITTGLQKIELSTITPDEYAEIYYLDDDEKTVSPDDIENLKWIVLTNHRLTFSIKVQDGRMTFEALESTYFESYYVRISLTYRSSFEKIEVRIEPGSPLVLENIEYDFESSHTEYRTEQRITETFTNNGLEDVVFHYYPYQDIYSYALFLPDEPWIDGLEYVAEIPVYNGEDWSEVSTQKIQMMFGSSVKFAPGNIDPNISLGITVSPETTATIDCNIGFSTLTIPYKATFTMPGTGKEEISNGLCEFMIPISYDVTVN